MTILFYVTLKDFRILTSNSNSNKDFFTHYRCQVENQQTKSEAVTLVMKVCICILLLKATHKVLVVQIFIENLLFFLFFSTKILSSQKQTAPRATRLQATHSQWGSPTEQVGEYSSSPLVFNQYSGPLFLTEITVQNVRNIQPQVSFYQQNVF